MAAYSYFPAAVAVKQESLTSSAAGAAVQHAQLQQTSHDYQSLYAQQQQQLQQQQQQQQQCSPMFPMPPFGCIPPPFGCFMPWMYPIPMPGMFPAMSGQSITAGSSKSPIKPMLPLMPHMPFCMPQQHCYVEQGAPLKQGGGSMQQEQLAPVVAADDDDAVFDEDVEVEEETWRLFEKVAAMERAKQAERASSPCGSVHSAATGATAELLHPGAPQQCCPSNPATADGGMASTAATIQHEVGPLPWLSLAVDDCGDDLDDDLAQLISLPEELSTPGAKAEAASAAGPVCSLKQGLLALKRVSSTGSAHSSGDVMLDEVAVKAAGAASQSAQGPKTKKVRIQLKKGSTGGSTASKPGQLPVIKGAGVTKTKAPLSKSRAAQSTAKAATAVDPATPAAPAFTTGGGIMGGGFSSLSLLSDSCFDSGGSCDALSPSDFDSAMEGGDGGWDCLLPGSEFDLAKLL